MSILIVLYGQENERNGALRPPAAARSRRAAELFRELAPGSEVVVLPTGAFGAHFNQTDLPHFYYLTQELISLGVPAENIMPGVNSSNTVQDSTEAWYRFKSGGFHRLIAVTSDYHAERVAFILGRLSVNDDAEIEVVTAETPPDYHGRDRELEPQKVATLRREWVDVIPRTANVPPGRFAAIYADAGREQQHYDTLSLAVVSALFIVNAFAFSVVPGRSGWVTFWLLAALAIVDLLLWSLYNRMAEAARMARRVLTRMEIEHRLPGFSSNWQPQTAEWFRSPPWLWSMKELVTALAAVMYAALVILSLSGPAAPRSEAVPDGQANSAASNVNAAPLANGSPAANALDRWADRVLGNSANSANTNSNRRRRSR